MKEIHPPNNGHKTNNNNNKICPILLTIRESIRKNLYNENCKTLMKEIKENIKTKIPVFMDLKN
jgi:hypothetical protein